MRWIGALTLLLGCGGSSGPTLTGGLTLVSGPSDETNGGGDATDDAPAGALTQPCVAGECLGDLVCQADVCVDESDPTGGSGAGATSSTSTTEPAATSEQATTEPHATATESSATATEGSATATTEAPDPSLTSGDASSSGGGAPEVCGDGQVDPGEACDDGDGDDDDECSDECVVQAAIEFVDVVDLPLAGVASGSKMFDDTCMGALYAFDGFSTNDHVGVGKVRGRCRPLYYVPDGAGHVLKIADSYELEFHGYGNGSVNLQVCSGGVIAGMRLDTDEDGVTGWFVYCSKLAIGNGEVVVDAPTLNGIHVGGNGLWGSTEYMCPDGKVVIGYFGSFTDARLFGVGLRCGRPVL